MKDKLRINFVQSVDGHLTFNERLAYSVLVYRARHRQGATAAKVSSYTSLSATRTVPTALSGLRDKRLAVQRKGKWYAVPPTRWNAFVANEVTCWTSDDVLLYKAKHPVANFSHTFDTLDFFRFKRSNSGEWFNQFAGFTLPVRLPRCPLTLCQSAVFWLLQSFWRSKDQPKVFRQSLASLETILGLAKSTVRLAVANLVADGWIKKGDTDNRGTQFMLSSPTAEQLDYFASTRTANIPQNVTTSSAPATTKKIKPSVSQPVQEKEKRPVHPTLANPRPKWIPTGYEKAHQCLTMCLREHQAFAVTQDAFANGITPHELDRQAWTMRGLDHDAVDDTQGFRRMVNLRRSYLNESGRGEVEFQLPSGVQCTDYLTPA